MRRYGFINETRLALANATDLARGITDPALRIGVTGLSRAGKTVFITALVHALIHRTRLPLFNAQAQGRIERAYLQPQPDDDLPRFAYEENLGLLTSADRQWPAGTRRMSQLRVTINYETAGFLARQTHGGKLHLDIVDYPGEWLLDLPLLHQSYAEWSHETLARSRQAPRKHQAKDWHQHLTSLEPDADEDEQQVQEAAGLFTAYLHRCREQDLALSTLLPGRFLMPGDLEGSPLVTFAPLDVAPDQRPTPGSIYAMMDRRYRSYVAHIVKPFFFDHFARLDRQIVLVDALSALNAGAEAVADLRDALGKVLNCFRTGQSGILSGLFSRKIDRIVFAATKADLLHHTSHDRLENILSELIADAAAATQVSGAAFDVVALSALRATQEATIRHQGEELPCITGIPEAGEIMQGETFDGKTRTAIFPGDLPADVKAAFDGSLTGELNFIRFRPPEIGPTPGAGFGHIRLDRSLEFLLGDAFS